MAKEGNKSDYVILAALGLVSVGAILAMVALGYVHDADRSAPMIRTTHSTNVEGMMVCYTLLERLEMEARRSERELLDDVVDDFDVLVLLAPTEPLASDEVQSLLGWIRRGGVLVCTPGPAEALGWDDATDQWGRYDYDEDEQTTISADHAELALARDVEKTYFNTVWHIEEAEVSDHGERFGSLEPLLEDSEGLRIAARAMGEGRLILLADSSFLANGWIGEADNAILAMNLICYARSAARGRCVGFDEYHFGYGERLTRWTALGGMLLWTSPGWAILSLTCAGVLFLLYRGRRFGVRRDIRRVRRRSKLEFVYSVGATYRAAGANRLTLGLIFNWLTCRCTRPWACRSRPGWRKSPPGLLRGPAGRKLTIRRCSINASRHWLRPNCRAGPWPAHWAGWPKLNRR